MEKLNTYYNTSLTRWLMAILFILLVGSLFAQPSVGDYQTTQNYVSFDSGSGWQYCSAVDNNGVPTWIGASQPPSSLSTNTLFINHLVEVHEDFVLNGELKMAGNGNIKIILNSTFTVGLGATVQLKFIDIGAGCTLTNNGTIESIAGDSDNATLSIGTGDATLNNNGSIKLNATNHKFTIAGGGLLRSGLNDTTGHYGTICGSGTISGSVTQQRPRFEIANPNGFSGPNRAVCLTGTETIEKADFLFNGTESQITGNLPSSVFSLVIDNPVGVELDDHLQVHSNGGFVTVNSGAVLNTGIFVIETESRYGNAVFTLEQGGTLITHHPEGVSLETIPSQYIKGCIQTNIAHYYGEIIVMDDTLPVTLSSFTAMVVGLNNVRISWVTASETNCLGYNIWRADSADLASATRISSMIQAENSSQGAHYAFTDTELYQEGTYYYWLEDISINYESQFHGHIHVRLDFQGDNHTPEIVEGTGFKSNYPNPFNPSTTLRYGLSQDSDLMITFYNLRGQVIDSKHLSNQSKGMHSMVWNTRDLGIPSGVYFARLNSKSGSDLLKITLSE